MKGAPTNRPAEARRLMIMVGLAGTANLLGCIGFVTTLPVAVLLMSGVVFLMYLTGSQ
jgi:ACS family hexuronate transporter-like MFS transporter